MVLYISRLEFHVESHRSRNRMFRYDLCRAKINGMERCGTLMPERYWAMPNKSKWRFYCKCDWQDVCSDDQVGQEIASVMQQHWGANMEMWPGAQPGLHLTSAGRPITCGSKCQPYKNGPSEVIYFQTQDI